MPIDTPVNPDFERLLADAMEALATMARLICSV